MTTLLHLKNLYVTAFDKLKAHEAVIFKSFAWIVAGFVALGIFAFIYRVASGFFVI
jgi:hypothetical protein